jgi:hypothetical protein
LSSSFTSSSGVLGYFPKFLFMFVTGLLCRFYCLFTLNCKFVCEQNSCFLCVKIYPGNMCRLAPFCPY